MATILKGYGRDGFGDRAPLIDVVLRDIAADLATLNGSAVPAATAAVVATANATDLATSEALANALKTQFNLLVADVAAMRTSLNAEVATLKTIAG